MIAIIQFFFLVFSTIDHFRIFQFIFMYIISYPFNIVISFLLLKSYLSVYDL